MSIMRNMEFTLRAEEIQKCFNEINVYSSDGHIKMVRDKIHNLWPFVFRSKPKLLKAGPAVYFYRTCEQSNCKSFQSHITVHVNKSEVLNKNAAKMTVNVNCDICSKAFKKRHYSHYDSDRLGPENWYQISPICNDGTRQSPIDLPVRAELKTSPLHIENFEVKPDSINISNDGHGAQIVFNYRDNAKCLVSGGPLKDNAYEVAKAHWHWGEFNDAGSEHRRNGRQYSAELHVVAFASKYGSLSNAVDKTDGLAVLAFFYELDNRNEERSDFIIKKDLGLIVKSNTNDYIRIQNSFSLKDLIKYQRFHYFSYQGSLTTPPCYESVTWIVAKTPLKIKTEDLDELRNLKDNEGRRILKNWRPIQNCASPITEYR